MSLRPALAKLERPYLRNKIQPKGLGLSSIGRDLPTLPWVQSQLWSKKKSKTVHPHHILPMYSHRSPLNIDMPLVIQGGLSLQSLLLLQHLAIMYTPHSVSQVPKDVSFHLGSAVGADEDTSLPISEEALSDKAALHGAGQCHGLLVLLQLLLQ